MILEQVISGGQTGVDQVGLRVAKELGYRTGGTAPKGWLTDAGPAPWLGSEYGLVEDRTSSYRNRTIENVRCADCTVWFGQASSPGGRLTKQFASGRTLPGSLASQWVENPTAAQLREILSQYPIRILNVAGNRLRTNPDVSVQAEAVLRGVLLK